MRLVLAFLVPMMAMNVVTARASAAQPSATAPARAPQPAVNEDSLARALQNRATSFFEAWDKAWRQSQLNRYAIDGKQTAPPPTKQESRRFVYQHCHAPERADLSEPRTRLDGKYAPLRSATAFSLCPTWLLTEKSEYLKGMSASESDSTDTAINSKLLPSVRSARASLIQAFDRAQLLMPAGAGIFGQRARLLWDQGLRDSAVAVAKSCNGDETFCAMLQGYFASRIGNIRSAAQLFNVARASQTPSQLCDWGDIRQLLPDTTAEGFATLPCATRQQLNARYWWLADPMFSDSLNERFVEHEARLVRMMLVAALPRDGRYFYWDRKRSADGLFKLVARYGWPTYLGWGGKDLDVSHTGWLQKFDTEAQEPYTTYEYTVGRVHTAPTFSVLSAPYTATDSSWDMYARVVEKDQAEWWPTEHMMRARPLVTLPSYQVAMLRRANDVILASAHDLRGPALDTLRMRAKATMLVTPAPDTFYTLAHEQLAGTEILRMRGNIRSQPTLFALEIADTVATGTDARTRIGIAPPAPLSAMNAGEIALSDPVLLQVSKTPDDELLSGDMLLNRMIGSTSISLTETPRFSVMFESYGVRARDTVSVSVSLHRRETLSAWRRLGIALRAADNPNASITIKWSEPNRSARVVTVDGAVPIQTRSVALDISQLTTGPYDLVVGIRRGVTETSSTRRINIVK